jgi:hypothetical protein
MKGKRTLFTALGFRLGSISIIHNVIFYCKDDRQSIRTEETRRKRTAQKMYIPNYAKWIGNEVDDFLILRLCGKSLINIIFSSFWNTLSKKTKKVWFSNQEQLREKSIKVIILKVSQVESPIFPFQNDVLTSIGMSTERINQVQLLYILGSPAALYNCTSWLIICIYWGNVLHLFVSLFLWSQKKSYWHAFAVCQRPG